jgi:hypothetical protein
VKHTSLLEKFTTWCASIPADESIPDYNIDEVQTLCEFHETFYPARSEAMITMYYL